MLKKICGNVTLHPVVAPQRCNDSEIDAAPKR